MCDYNITNGSYMEIKINSESPCAGHEVVRTLIWGSICVVLVGIVTNLIHRYYSKRPVNLYSYLQRQHILSSLLQLIGSTIYYIEIQTEGVTTISEILYQAITYLNLLIPIWTTCIALKIFSDLYIFNGAEVYTTKEVTRFAHGSVIIIEVYEELLLYYFYSFEIFSEDILIPAIRSTSVFLVMSAAIVILIFVFVNLIKPPQNDRKMPLLFFIHLFILISCDCVLVVYKVHSADEPSKLFYIDAVLLSVRLVLEMLWWVVTMFLNIPLSGKIN